MEETKDVERAEEDAEIIMAVAVADEAVETIAAAADATMEAVEDITVIRAWRPKAEIKEKELRLKVATLF